MGVRVGSWAMRWARMMVVERDLPIALWGGGLVGGGFSRGVWGDRLRGERGWGGVLLWL